MIEGVIFDLDGTLVDTLEDLADSINAAIQEYGYATHPIDSYRYFVGNGIRVAVSRATKLDESHEDLDKIVKSFMDNYSTMHTNKSVPFEGIRELLVQLVLRNIPIAVCSNKLDEYTKLMIKELFPTIPFVDVMGETVGIARKPSPDMALMVLEKMNLNADKVLFVGDTKTDMLTAGAVGCISVGVSWGFRPVEELKEYGAKHIIYHPEQLLDLL